MISAVEAMIDGLFCGTSAKTDTFTLWEAYQVVEA